MKFKRLIACCCLICAVIFLTSCGGIHLDNTPDTNATVYGNGGTSVIKGDYIYFVNSYKNYSGLGKKDNKNGEVKTGAIYRVKLADNKVRVENDEVQDYEMVVSKVVGYEYTNLYIFDDYIYYPTPNMDYDRSGKLNTSAIDFSRTRLDGTGTEILYTAKNYNDSSSYELYKIGTSVYLMIFEKDKIVKVEVSNNRIKSPVTLMSNVLSVLFPKITTYAKSDNIVPQGTQGYVYYTRAFNEDLDNAYDTSSITGNVLGRVNISNGAISERKDHDVSYSLKALSDDYIFVTKGVDIYAIDKSFPLLENLQGVQDERISFSGDSLTISNFYVMQNTSGYAYSKGEKTYYTNNVKDGYTIEINSSSKTIVKDDGKFAYYVDDKSIYRLALEESYINNEEFTLTNQATINGEIMSAGSTIPAKTIISAEEFRALTSALDINKFKRNTDPELVVSDSNLVSEYIDYTQNDSIYYFATYTGASESQPYMCRVWISEQNKILPSEDDVNQNTNLGYNKELLCVLDEAHKA